MFPRWPYCSDPTPLCSAFLVIFFDVYFLTRLSNSYFPICYHHLRSLQYCLRLKEMTLYTAPLVMTRGGIISWFLADIRYLIFGFSGYPIADKLNCSLSTDTWYFLICRYPIFPSLQFVTDMISDIWNKADIYPYPIYRKTGMPSLVMTL